MQSNYVDNIPQVYNKFQTLLSFYDKLEAKIPITTPPATHRHIPTKTLKILSDGTASNRHPASIKHKATATYIIDKPLRRRRPERVLCVNVIDHRDVTSNRFGYYHRIYAYYYGTKNVPLNQKLVAIHTKTDVKMFSA